ncbi:hypothetical protein TH53_17600 [Pedobacter lusitanus]|uniref:Uncharacterized protein n=1 Tax=Pedobacter lusitanus TaxID=1503925 RepID=A0A0D0F337_9SPHI|nr:hypothetical protein [Pedobacter lusitanus]KIO75983.1 hypothetical protein TH53_17600 [Pedobacter lusitanus]
MLHSKKEYDALPDTLYKMMYGDRLFCVTRNNVNGENDTRYSIEKKNEAEQKLKTINPQQTREINWIRYTVLADKGKTEYPKLAPLYQKNGITSNLVKESEYGNGFNLFNQGPSLSGIPLLAKIKILQFLKSETNHNFKIDRGDQSFTDLILVSDFTKKEEADVAIVLREITEAGITEQYKLLVYSYSPYKGEYYVLFNENYYDPVLIKNLNASFEYDIYMNGEEKVKPDFPPLMVKQQGRADRALVYNKEFDKMVQYIQEPKKQQTENKVNEETTEE